MSSSKHQHFTNAIVGGEQVAKGTQPWVGVIGTARFKDSAKGENIYEFLCRKQFQCSKLLLIRSFNDSNKYESFF